MKISFFYAVLFVLFIISCAKPNQEMHFQNLLINDFLDCEEIDETFGDDDVYFLDTGISNTDIDFSKYPNIKILSVEGLFMRGIRTRVENFSINIDGQNSSIDFFIRDDKDYESGKITLKKEE